MAAPTPEENTPVQNVNNNPHPPISFYRELYRNHFKHDSASMTPPRIKILKDILIPIVSTYQLANPDGITSVRFINDYHEHKNVKEEGIGHMLSSVGWWGNSRIALALRRKVLEPLGLMRGETGNIDKMLLVLVVTDGEIEGEDPKNLKELIDDTLLGMKERYCAGAVAFQFGRIGMDDDPNNYLLELDKNTSQYVDSVPLDIKLEMIEKGEESKWDALRKILCGAIDNWVNDDDERSGDEEEEEYDQDVQPSAS
ncbi:uncharacterized protein H6S33_007058 [Morchella sextelata]|uniref:uncharacterized protein n=1 Tax=Morchella sextelata TaxID=1174677 RepID=UPI001D03F95D|nr:uncharacterized protein H6S33_007058 [Morchella sextelata]KAH0604027.1 hypothetical protein H6S33_007058 [Morchella sextelata]